METTDGNGTHRLNPLLVDLVLENVMRFLSSKDLVATRAVCQHWNEISTKQMSKRAVKSIYFQEGTADLLEIVKGSSNFPLINFGICLGRFISPENTLLFDKFLKTCGGITKQLELQIDRRVLEGNFLHSQSPLIESRDSSNNEEFYALEKFKIWYDASIDEFIGSEQLTFLTLLLKRMPNLKSFNCKTQNTANAEVIDLLCELIAENIFPNLDEVVLQGGITNKNLATLSKFKGGLKKLELCFLNSDATYDYFKKLLESQRKSLETLTLSGINLGEIPQLEKLQTLTLSERISGNPLSYENRRSFLQLKKIKLGYTVVHEIFITQGQRMGVFPSVEKLKFYKGLHSETKPLTVLSIVPNVFPNLKRLRLRFTPEWMTSVFSTLPELEELVVDENNLVSHAHDYVLTGMSQETCAGLIREGFDKNMDILHLQVEASLLNLTKLKHFRLINRNRILNASKCSDLSGYFVFMRMKNLQSVITYLNGFSDECLSEMKKKMSVTSSLDYLRMKQK